MPCARRSGAVLAGLLALGAAVSPQDDEASDVARRFDQEVRAVQLRARSDGDRLRPNLDTIQKLQALEAEFRASGVPRERLAYVLYDAADRLERKLDRNEAAAALFRESWQRYPDTHWGGQECLRRFRELTMRIGARFPALSGRGLEGKPFELQPGKARLSIVAFVEPRQPLCRSALEDLWLGLTEQPRDVKLVIAAIGEVAELWGPWLAARGIEASTVLPKDSRAADWPTQFALESVPHFFLLDRDSTVLASDVDPASILAAVAKR